MTREKFLHYYQQYMFLVGIAGHFIFVLQALKIWQLGSSADVSLLGFLCCFWAVCSWFLYGVLIRNTVLFWVNLFGVVSGLICLGMIVWYGQP